MRKSDVNPLGAALPQSFLRRKKSFLFRCFLYADRFRGFEKKEKFLTAESFDLAQD